jgi:hypothetical protein
MITKEKNKRKNNQTKKPVATNTERNKKDYNTTPIK